MKSEWRKTASMEMASHYMSVAAVLLTTGGIFFLAFAVTDNTSLKFFLLGISPLGIAGVLVGLLNYFRAQIFADQIYKRMRPTGLFADSQILIIKWIIEKSALTRLFTVALFFVLYYLVHPCLLPLPLETVLGLAASLGFLLVPRIIAEHE